MLPTLQLLDLTPYGRQETWEDSPAGWPTGRGRIVVARVTADQLLSGRVPTHQSNRSQFRIRRLLVDRDIEHDHAPRRGAGDLAPSDRGVLHGHVLRPRAELRVTTGVEDVAPNKLIDRPAPVIDVPAIGKNETGGRNMLTGMRKK